MRSFTEEQTALVVETNAVSDRAKMAEAAAPADKLRLPDQYHELNLQEITYDARYASSAEFVARYPLQAAQSYYAKREGRIWRRLKRDVDANVSCSCGWSMMVIRGVV
jgi:hypothetical protein